MPDRLDEVIERLNTLRIEMRRCHGEMRAYRDAAFAAHKRFGDSEREFYELVNEFSALTREDE